MKILLVEDDTGSALGKGNDSGIKSIEKQLEMLIAEPSKSHNIQFNYLFVDSHVELLLPYDTKDPDLSFGKSGKYWTLDPSD